MSRKFYYDNDKPILVTEETYQMRVSPFQKNGKLWESKQIKEFFNRVQKYIQKYPDKNINILDIGAQVGLYSLYAKYLPNCTFYAFEPNDNVRKLLEDNIKLNNITNVKVYNIGISSEKSTKPFNISLDHPGLSRFADPPKDSVHFGQGKSYQSNVETDTIDNLFLDIPIHFIKIDTEGHEYYILNGSKKVIDKYNPMIQLEYYPANIEQAGLTVEMLDNVIEEINYKKDLQLGSELIIISKN